MAEFSQEEFLQLAGMTTFHAKIFVMASLAQLADGAINGALPLVSAWMQCEFKVSVVATALMNSSLYVMRAFGTALQGKMADRYGRVRTLTIFLCLAVWSCVMFALSPTLVWVMILRSVMGFAGGGLLVEFMIEYCSVYHRKVFVLVRESYCLGSMYTFLLSYLLIKQSGWRTIMVFIAVLPFVSCAMAWTIPEPPRFLTIHGKVKKAVQSMKHIYSVAWKKLAASDGPVRVTMPYPNGNTLTPSSLKTLFNEENFKVTLILMLLKFASGCLETGAILLSVTYFREAYRSERTVLHVQCSQCNHLELDYYRNQIFYATGCVSGGVISFFLLDRLGRKKVMTLMLIIITLCWFCLAVWGAKINLVALFFLIRFSCTGFITSCSFYAAEIYSTSIRGRSTSFLEIVDTMGDLFSIGVGEVLVTWNRTASALIFATLGAVCAMVCFCLKVETMGADLEDK